MSIPVFWDQSRILVNIDSRKLAAYPSKSLIATLLNDLLIDFHEETGSLRIHLNSQTPSNCYNLIFIKIGNGQTINGQSFPAT